MYAQEAERKELKKDFKDVKDYLSDLQIKIEIKKNSLADIERITQLINKTNQFNLCTNRYTKEQVESIIESEKVLRQTIVIQTPRL